MRRGRLPPGDAGMDGAPAEAAWAVAAVATPHAGIPGADDSENYESHAVVGQNYEELYASDAYASDEWNATEFSYDSDQSLSTDTTMTDEDDLMNDTGSVHGSEIFLDGSFSDGESSSSMSDDFEIKDGDFGLAGGGCMSDWYGDAVGGFIGLQAGCWEGNWNQYSPDAGGLPAVGAQDSPVLVMCEHASKHAPMLATAVMSDQKWHNPSFKLEPGLANKGAPTSRSTPIIPSRELLLSVQGYAPQGSPPSPQRLHLITGICCPSHDPREQSVNFSQGLTRWVDTVCPLSADSSAMPRCCVFCGGDSSNSGCHAAEVDSLAAGGAVGKTRIRRKSGKTAKAVRHPGLKLNKPP